MLIPRPEVPETIEAIGAALHDAAPLGDLDCHFRIKDTIYQIMLCKSGRKFIIYEHCAAVDTALGTIAYSLFVNTVWCNHNNVKLRSLPKGLYAVTYPVSDPTWPDLFKKRIILMHNYYMNNMVVQS
jgi:hypothetical protein